MKRIKNIVVAGLLVAVLPSSGFGTPLTMDYMLTDLGMGLYQYDFTLTLDNHDTSWTAGQEWDWIVFGDAQSASSPLTNFGNFVATNLAAQQNEPICAHET